MSRKLKRDAVFVGVCGVGQESGHRHSCADSWANKPTTRLSSGYTARHLSAPFAWESQFINQRLNVSRHGRSLFCIG